MGQKFKILIVEDDDAIVDSLQQILESEGYVTLWADTLYRASRLMKLDTPNLILLDYRLPDGKPDEFVKEVSKTSSIPIILITAATNADVIASALNIKKVIKKPFGVD